MKTESKSFQVPFDILDQIVDTLYDSYDDSESGRRRYDLQSCALVCWSFTQICRKYIWRALHCDFGSFAKILQKSPELADYVRKLDIRIGLPDLMELKMFSRLQSCSFCFPDDDDDDFREIKLQEIWPVPMPSLTCLKLSYTRNFPFHELPACFPNINDLDVVCALMDDNPADSVTHSAPKPLKLGKLRINSGTRYIYDTNTVTRNVFRLLLDQAVIDISELKSIEISEDLEHGHTEWKTTLAMVFLAKQLTTLTLTGCIELSDLDGIGESLVGLTSTLKEINITRRSREIDPFSDMCQELAVFARCPNVLETLSYWLVFERIFCDTGVVWETLDQLIDEFPWPHLKTVRLLAEVRDSCRYPWSLREEFVRRLRAIPYTYFPLLCAREDLRFEYGVADIPNYRLSGMRHE